MGAPSIHILFNFMCIEVHTHTKEVKTKEVVKLRSLYTILTKGDKLRKNPKQDKGKGKFGLPGVVDYGNVFTYGETNWKIGLF